MKKIGLTGGIASGKSTISHVLKEMGARIIDADLLAREVLMPGTAAYSETVKLFGKRILSSDGRIDRKALGGIVFRDPGSGPRSRASSTRRYFAGRRR